LLNLKSLLACDNRPTAPWIPLFPVKQSRKPVLKECLGIQRSLGIKNFIVEFIALGALLAA